jgi:hypothetical protein
MPRYIPFLVLFLPLACGSPKSDQTKAGPEDVTLAREFIESLQKDTAYRLGREDAVQNEIDRQKASAKALLRGSVELLRSGNPAERRQAARFLGRLGDKSAAVGLSFFSIMVSS